MNNRKNNGLDFSVENIPVICLQLGLSLLKRMFFKRKACKETQFQSLNLQENILWSDMLHLLVHIHRLLRHFVIYDQPCICQISIATNVYTYKTLRC